MNKLIVDELGTGKTAEQVRIKWRLRQIELACNCPDEAVVEENSLPNTEATLTDPWSPENLA